MSKLLLLTLCAVAVSAGSTTNERIIGGSVTTINNYPSIVALLFNSVSISYFQHCGGTILNQRSILTAANCLDVSHEPGRWRIRAGSTYANGGGTVYTISNIILHPNYRRGVSLDYDISIMRTASTIVYVNNAVQPASIAGTNYNLADNQVVWAAGWGLTVLGWPSEQLRHIQIWTVNQAVCRQSYGSQLTDNMLCAGWLASGGRHQCDGDTGGPLYHSGVVVGITSWGHGCGMPMYPGVNTRVSRFTTWIQANA